jgi:hypothetical protein
MALPVIAPYAQTQSSYVSGCVRSFAEKLNNSSDFAPESFIQRSILLDFADKVEADKCRLFSAEVPGVSLLNVKCGEHFYKPVNLQPFLRSVPLMDFEFSDIKKECELNCMGITTDAGMMNFLAKIFTKLRKAIITSVDELLLGAISRPVSIDDCGTDRSITMEDDGVPTINATATGGLTDAVVSQVLVALSENNALSNNADDVLLVLPQRAVSQWRASLPGNSLDFADYRNSSNVNRVRGMYVYVPMNQTKVFKKVTTTGTSPVTGIAAYAVVRDALRFGYKTHSTYYDDPTANRVNINFGYGVAAVGANTFDVKRGLHFAYDLQAGAMRQAPWGIVRILLPSTLFTA